MDKTNPDDPPILPDEQKVYSEIIDFGDMITGIKEALKIFMN